MTRLSTFIPVSLRLKLLSFYRFIQGYKNVYIRLSYPKKSETYSPVKYAVFKKYNLKRKFGPRKQFCYAANTNIFFNTFGTVQVCCFNTQYILGKFPSGNLHDIWFSKTRKKISDFLQHNDLSLGCSYCEYQLQTGKYTNLKPQANDLYATTDFNKYPRLMEFELSNHCNLECVMCSGRVSSAIRKNREHQIPMPCPYDDNFVEQLKEFIPHLKEAKFFGGEPFLIDIYYKIWDLIIEMKPSIKVYVLTNGTVFNEKVKTYIQKGNFDIGISLDALDKELYESIRVNANFEKVMEHLKLFHKYCSERGKTLGLSITPMRLNWREVPKLVNFANTLQASLYFSFVEKPEHLALWNWDKKNLREIYENWTSYSLDEKTERQKINKHYFEDLCRQVKHWLEHTESGYVAATSGEEKKIEITVRNEILPFEEANNVFFNKLKNYVIEHYRNDSNAETIEKTVLKKINDVLASIEDEEYRCKLMNRLCDLEINDMMLDEILHTETQSLIEKARYFLG